jgi:hypothetical protein
MDPELKSLLEENIRLSKENNDLLRIMRRNAQWGLVGKIIFWLLLFVAPLIFVWGYIGPLMNALNGTGDSTFNSGNLQQLLDQYKAQNQ